MVFPWAAGPLAESAGYIERTRGSGGSRLASSVKPAATAGPGKAVGAYSAVAVAAVE